MIDATKKKIKTQELRHPLRIKVTKSPVIINYRLYQVGVSIKDVLHHYVNLHHIFVQYVSNWPREEIQNKRHGRPFDCRDHWYAKDDEVNCGFARVGGEKIFDSQVRALSALICVYSLWPSSQGFCCKCAPGFRGSTESCSGFTNKISREVLMKAFSKRNLPIGHCMVHDGLK